MRILVIRFSSLGDVVLAAAPLRALAVVHPDAKIVFATKSEYAPLFEGFGSPIQFVPLTRGQSLRDFKLALGDTDFDLVVDLHGSSRSRLLCVRLNARKVQRVKKHAWRRWRMVWSKIGLNQPLSVMKSYMDAAGIREPHNSPRLSLSIPEQQAASEIPVGIGIGWGAKHPTKSPPPVLWEQVLARVDRGGVTNVYLFGLETDRAGIEQFVMAHARTFAGLSLHAIYGQTLRETMVYLSRCTVFLGADSGLMHLAAALGVPTAGLFGPTHPALGFAPTGDHVRAFHAGTWCSPCHRHGRSPCFRDERHCFSDLDTMAITTWAEPFLSGTTR